MGRMCRAKGVLSIVAIIALMGASGCNILFTSVTQPIATQTNTTFLVSVAVSYENTLGRDVTNFFSVKLPVGWTVVGNAAPFSGGVNGTSVFDASASALMETLSPAGAGYYWWTGSNVSQAANVGQAVGAFSIQTDGQTGLFLIDYALGDAAAGLNHERSNGHPIGIGLPQAVFTATPTNGIMPMAVQFTAPDKDSGGSTLLTWSWDFGDGVQSTLQNPSHIYTAVGTFLPTLLASNTAGGFAVSPVTPITAGLLPGYGYSVNGTTIAITNYTGPGGVVVIPAMIGTYPVTAIGTTAFAFHPSMTSVAIPDAVTNISALAFAGCTVLTNFTVDASNTSFSSVDGVLFDSAHTTLIEFPSGRAGSYTLPDGVTAIGDGAFCYSLGLTSLALPASLSTLGSAVFAYCPVLTNITVDPANTSFASVDGILFDSTHTALLAYPGGRGGSYTIPDGVTAIGGWAFCYNTGLTNITIPYGVTTIGQLAFSFCTGLTSLTIPASVTVFGQQMISNCGLLASVFCLGNANDSCLDGFQGSSATLYYPPGAAGWDTYFTGCPVALWNPEIHADNFGVSGGRFGFTVTGTEGIPIVVKTCTNLHTGAWSSLQSTNVDGGSIYFADNQWTNFPARFYRIGTP